MNRYTSLLNIIFGVTTAIGLSACEKNYEMVFEELPDQRLRESLNEYTSLLIDAPFGWTGILQTGSEIEFFYYFDFDEDGGVTMLSDFNETTAGTIANTTWVLKALQRPTLSFSTYSYIHLPADPDGQVNGGGYGSGLGSDIEFAFEKAVDDSIFFKGTQRGSTIKLTKATQAEAASILDKDLFNVLFGTQQYIEDNKGLQIALPDGTKVPVVIDISQRLFGAQYVSEGGNKVESFQSRFTFSIEGIILKSAFEIGGYSIDKLLWDNDKEFFAVVLDENTEVESFTDPFIFDLDPPLHDVLGHEYGAIVIPEGSGARPLHGQSDVFITAYNTAAESLLEGEFKLTLRDMTFAFDSETKTMELQIMISQVNNGVASMHMAQYSYAYTINDEGILKFSFQGANENGWTIYGDMYEILFHIENDNFKAEFIGGDLNLIGGLFSQNDEGFYLSGYIE